MNSLLEKLKFVTIQSTALLGMISLGLTWVHPHLSPQQESKCASKKKKYPPVINNAIAKYPFYSNALLVWKFSQPAMFVSTGEIWDKVMGQEPTFQICEEASLNRKIHERHDNTI